MIKLQLYVLETVLQILPKLGLPYDVMIAVYVPLNAFYKVLSERLL